MDTGKTPRREGASFGPGFPRPLGWFFGLQQLQGDYGGNLPTTPYAKRNDGRGPAWANSLLEDNAEFGLGMRLASDKLGAFAQEMLLKSGLDAALVEAITKADVSTQEGIEAKRALVAKAKTALTAKGTPEAKRLIEVIDFVVPRSVWIFGGDGWAYDIGFGGLDHVLASGNKVNILCVDTGVYSNTGGQASKSTPRGAAACGLVQEKTDASGLISLCPTLLLVAHMPRHARSSRLVGPKRSLRHLHQFFLHETGICLHRQRRPPQRPRRHDDVLWHHLRRHGLGKKK